MTRAGAWLTVLGLGWAAVGCAPAAVEGRVVVRYHANSERGEKGQQPGLRMTFVNESNDAFVDPEGKPRSEDTSVKIVSDVRMAELLDALDDAGFAAHAQAGAFDDALATGAREVIGITAGGRERVFAEPRRPLDTDAKKALMRAFVGMKQVLFAEQQNHTQFHVVGQGQDRPTWAPAPR
jgi:hypothetical protein